jgi:outer membrane protein TolC
VRAWLEIRALECQLALNRRTIANYQDNLQLVEQRYRRGLVPPVDVHLARQNLSAARASQPQGEEALLTARRRLEILAGRYPEGSAARAVTSADRREASSDRGQSSTGRVEEECACRMPPELAPIPAGLPSDLLERRPDIQAAEMRLRAATARIGEAKAALFPRLSLTGQAGYRTREFSELFSESASIWSLVGALTAPLLNRGAQKSQIRSAEARTVAALAAYRGTVLNAFGEVEAALEAERAQQERRGWLLDAVAQARWSLELAEERYRRGLEGLLLILDTQRRLYQAESELIRTEQAYRTARINLILALGGPWREGAQP